MSRPVVLVTGACRGIGRAVAESFAAAGYDVGLADRQRDSAAETACAAVARLGGEAVFESFDLADLGAHGPALDRLQSHFGRLDCIVANAGIGSPVRCDPLELLPGSYDAVMAVNLRGTVFFTQQAARRMIEAPDPGTPRALILITSVNADVAAPERADYCMSKAGLSMWTKTLALRLAPSAIGVFEIRPGIIRTDMTARGAEGHQRLIDGGAVPAGRWGEPADVARVAVALASGAFAFASGTVVNADGGLAIPRM